VNTDLNQLERRTERALADVATHLAAACPPDVLQRTRLAVRAEAARHRTRQRWLRASPWLATAAAVLLALALQTPSTIEEPALEPVVAGEPAEFLEEWADVSALAGERLTLLLADPWYAVDQHEAGDESPDETLETLEEALQALEQVTGV